MRGCGDGITSGRRRGGVKSLPLSRDEKRKARTERKIEKRERKGEMEEDIKNCIQKNLLSIIS